VLTLYIVTLEGALHKVVVAASHSTGFCFVCNGYTRALIVRYWGECNLFKCKVISLVRGAVRLHATVVSVSAAP
jgi:hypothetical protein